jgi:hypothetical protein
MQLPLPSLTVNVALLPFAIVAVSMIGITIFVLFQLLPRDRSATLLSTMVIGVAALGGGLVLLLALLYVYVDPNGTTAWTWVLLAFNFMMMGPAGLWFVSLMLFRDRTIDRIGWSWPVVLALVTVGSEVLMGVLFGTASAGWIQSLPVALASGLTSVWFDWSMAAVMGALLLWLPLHGVVRGTLATLTAAAVLAPWVTAYPGVGAGMMGLLMTGVLLVLYQRWRHQPSLASAELSALTGLGAAFVAMVAAQAAIVLAPGSTAAAIAFGGIMAIVMAGEVASATHHALAPSPASSLISLPGVDAASLPVPGAARQH